MENEEVKSKRYIVLCPQGHFINISPELARFSFCDTCVSEGKNGDLTVFIEVS
jgi:hypothetical protein